MSWTPDNPLDLATLGRDDLVAHLTAAVHEREAVIAQLRYQARCEEHLRQENRKATSKLISQLYADERKLRRRHDGRAEALLHKEIDHRNFVIETLLNYISDTLTNNHQRRAIIDALRSPE